MGKWVNGYLKKWINMLLSSLAKLIEEPTGDESLSLLSSLALLIEEINEKP